MYEDSEKELVLVFHHVCLLSCHLEIQNKTMRKERVKLPAGGF
jgi:hypothetical protein